MGFPRQAPKNATWPRHDSRPLFERGVPFLAKMAVCGPNYADCEGASQLGINAPGRHCASGFGRAMPMPNGEKRAQIWSGVIAKTEA